MKPVQPAQPGNLLTDLQNEVSEESAPLLQFITRYAGWIAGLVILLLAAMGGMAIWNWYTGKQLSEMQEQISLINMRMEASQKPQALEKLIQSAPDKMKLFLYMNLAQLALENNDLPLASSAYANASKLDGSSALGLTAALGNAGTLLMQNRNTEALSLLKSLSSSMPTINQKPQFQQLLAEAALRAGDKQLAARAFEDLSKLADPQEAEYFRARMKAVAK